MALIRPCADLRNNYNEISKICHETKQPVFITRNGYNDLVILSNETFEQYEEQRLSSLIATALEQKFVDFESFKKEIYSKIEEGLKEIKEGKYYLAQDVFEDLEGKYNIGG